MCGIDSIGSEVRVKEMMFGLREEFVYTECGNCHSLQIAEKPESLSKYYPASYYSFSGENRLLKIIGDFAFSAGSVLQELNADPSILKNAIAAFPDFREVRHHVGILNLKSNSRILDVGCGDGRYLRILRLMGFRSLVGIDPYMKSSFSNSGISLISQEISSVDGLFDVVLFNHSFEHMSSPAAVLEKAGEILPTCGRCMIRIPVVSSYAWKAYGQNWIQLDPPRHVFIPTVKGIEIIARKCGFKISSVEYDSTEFQFWGSEQNRRSIPLMSPTSYSKNPRKSMFTRAQIASFRRMARQLNLSHEGDQATFYLERT
jgi:SAM-dependent methyltransferase